ALRIEGVRPARRSFIQNADEASWRQITSVVESARENLRKVLALTGERRREIEDFELRIAYYSAGITRLLQPVGELDHRKAELRRTSLEFADEIERNVITPFRAEEGLQIYNGQPIDPFKTRVKDEAYWLLSLYMKQQVLLLELILDSDLTAYEKSRGSIADDIARHKEQLRSMAILLGTRPELQPVFDSLQNKIDGLLRQESAITSGYATVLAIDVDLQIAEQRLIEMGRGLHAVISADIERADRTNRLVSLLILAGIVCAVGIFGALLARDVIRIVVGLEAAQGALRLSEQNLRITLDSIGDGVIATDIGGRVTAMNRVAEQLTGRAREEARGAPLGEVLRIVDTDTRQAIEDPVVRVLRERRVVEVSSNATLLSFDGKEYRISDSGAPIQDEQGTVSGVVLVFRDATERFRLQERLRQSEKMEAVGQLAGGVAHDFNNMLMGIGGAAELLQLHAQEHPETAQYVRLITTTVARAAELTRKLLSFSRKGMMLSSVFDLHTCIESALALLERSIDKRIVIRRDFHADTANVKGDSAQLQSAFLNLGLNARDAMPDGGTFAVVTRCITLDEAYCRQSAFALTPGRYVEITVSDTGIGMDRSTLSRVFEPFFTTKGRDKGTGLGLASVYGAVKEHGGDIHVYSEPSKGTAFRICLPATTAEIAPVARNADTPAPRAARILIVDDEEIIRSSVAGFLRGRGVAVLVATDGVEALDVFRREHASIDLVILDLIMPRKSGRETFYEIRTMDPRARVVISSGFPLDTNAQELVDHGACGFIQKPYRLGELAELIDQALK
ncbi:MAG TPA: ATP-binding protein, partial [Spirochaetia bacterium]